MHRRSVNMRDMSHTAGHGTRQTRDYTVSRGGWGGFVGDTVAACAEKRRGALRQTRFHISVSISAITCQISWFRQMVWWRDSCLSIVPLFSKHQILMKCKLNAAATSLTARLGFFSTLSPPMRGCNENWSHHTKNVFTSGLAWHKPAALKGTTHIWGNMLSVK